MKLGDRCWVNMPKLMEQFGVTVANGEASAVAARDDAGDSGNGEGPAVAARDDAGDLGNSKAPAVAEERSSKRKRGDEGN
jgi:hypothetical protein